MNVKTNIICLYIYTYRSGPQILWPYHRGQQLCPPTQCLRSSDTSLSGPPAPRSPLLTHTHTRARAHTRTYIHTHTYIHTCMHAYIHTYIHRYVKTRSKHSGEDVIYGMGGLNEDVTRMYTYIHTYVPVSYTHLTLPTKA